MGDDLRAKKLTTTPAQDTYEEVRRYCMKEMLLGRMDQHYAERATSYWKCLAAKEKMDAEQVRFRQISCRDAEDPHSGVDEVEAAGN